MFSSTGLEPQSSKHMVVESLGMAKVVMTDADMQDDVMKDINPDECEVMSDDTTTETNEVT